MRNAYLFAVLMFLSFGIVGNTYATFRVTEAEMANLPQYCADRYKGRNSDQWEQTLGRDFGHTHHYCNALNFLNRYYRARTLQDKKYNLNNAMTNLNYMVTHASPSYSLMPEIYASRGLTFSLMNSPGQAIEDLIKAIKLDPRQSNAFNTLANIYIGIKQRDKALEVVTEGLRHNPDAKNLQSRYTELGGKLPYPSPPIPELVSTPVKPPIEETSAPTVLVPAKQVVETPTLESSQPSIGSPKNPYCRFCPD